MRIKPRTYLPLLAASIMAVYLVLTAGADTASAKSYGHGDCWRPGLPLTCQVSYVYSNHYYEIFKYWCNPASCTSNTAWNNALASVKGSWTSAPGPQFMVGPFETPGGYNKTNVFMYEYPWYTDNIGGLAQFAWGVAYDRRQDQSWCLLTQPCNIAYAQIFINKNHVDTNSQYLRWTMAHELGHALGLAHHPTQTAVMYQNYVSGLSPFGPTALDYGNTPPCVEDPEPGGGDDLTTIRCIYKWPPN